jgi:hypothetical protein
MSRTDLIVVTFAPAPVPAPINLGWSDVGSGQTCDGGWSLPSNGRGKLIDITRRGNACDAKATHLRLDAQGHEVRP